jgi:hypothetical protein
MKLVEAGILEETPEREHPRLYLAPGILQLVSAFETTTLGS